MIEKNITLKKLDLTDCKLTGENIIFIFNSKGSKGLKHIILNLNEISDLGFVGTLGDRKNSPKIEILELTNIDRNDIGLTSLFNLFNCVKNCENIKKIFFGKNKVNSDCLEIVKKFGEELKNKELIIFLDKQEDNKEIEYIEGK